AHRLAAWSADLDPQSDLESYLVTDLVAASWKLDRGRRVEALALAESIHAAALRSDDLLAHQHQQFLAELSLGQPQAVAKLSRPRAGCRWLAEHWQALGHSLQRHGRWSLEQTREVLSLLGCDPAREAFSHPAARRPLAAAVALLSSTRPTAE